LLNAGAEIILFENKKKIIISETNKYLKKYLASDKAIKLVTAILNKIEA
jgi:transcription termination factor NusB